ncbi:MAG TPA: hypothetical protein VJJ52_03620 [Candidatus Nanoarchaeia archaeon]|nr:hypothetical protein [Candidatus Nanoarchaeia archaeon]
MAIAIPAETATLVDIVVTADRSNDTKRGIAMISLNDPREKHLGLALLHAVEEKIEPGSYVVEQPGRDMKWYFTRVQQ